MKKIAAFILVLIAIAVIGYGLFYVHKIASQERAAEEAGETPVKSAEFTKRGEHGETLIVLSKEEQKNFGIEVSTLEIIEATPEVYAFGSVVDISPLAALATELKTARLNLQTALREYERVKRLFEDGNAPIRNVESAKDEVKKNELTIQGIKTRLVLTWGKKVAEIEDLDAFLRPFAEWEKTLVRIDLLPAQQITEPPRRATLSIFGDEKNSFEAEYFSLPPAVDGSAQSRSFLYVINGKGLPYGTKIVARLKSSNEPIKGLFFPESSIIRFSGSTFAYKQVKEDAFERLPVELGQAVEGGWIVTRHWSKGDKIVTRGAQMLFSEELKSQIKLVE